jgi:DNA-binding XRE family transcriptional regulator
MKNGPRLLKRFRMKARLSHRQAAEQLGVSHVALIAWEAGKNNPADAMRLAIARWTSGAVPADSWPLTKVAARRAARVRPCTPAPIGRTG